MDSISRAYTPEQQRQIAADWYDFEPPMNHPLWDDKTAEQLKTLRTLLWDIATLNNGSGCLDVLQRSVDAAKSLTESGESLSFIERLVRDCVNQRAKPWTTPTS